MSGKPWARPVHDSRPMVPCSFCGDPHSYWYGPRNRQLCGVCRAKSNAGETFEERMAILQRAEAAPSHPREGPADE